MKKLLIATCLFVALATTAIAQGNTTAPADTTTTTTETKPADAPADTKGKPAK